MPYSGGSMNEEEEDTTKTTAKTLWTETVLEILYESLRKHRDDDNIRDVLREVRQKGYKPEYIINKVGSKVDKQAAERVRGLMKKK